MSSTKPTQTELDEASKIEIYDHKGNKTTFGEAVLNQEGTSTVAFIRHFWCGNCQQYVVHLSAKVLPKTSVYVIGCGDWELIDKYTEMTDFPSDRIFANPDRKLYHALGMTTETWQSTPAGEERKSYLTTSKLANTMKSISTGPLANLGKLGKQGNTKQIGGEFIFRDKECIFMNRMQHTEDHAEADQLLKEAGVE